MLRGYRCSSSFGIVIMIVGEPWWYCCSSHACGGWCGGRWNGRPAPPSPRAPLSKQDRHRPRGAHIALPICYYSYASVSRRSLQFVTGKHCSSQEGIDECWWRRQKLKWVSLVIQVRRERERAQMSERVHQSVKFWLIKDRCKLNPSWHLRLVKIYLL